MDAGIFRNVGAIILGLLGIVLVSTNLQQRFALATSKIGNAGNNVISEMRLDGLLGQLAIGLVLGVVWSPCVGPTYASETGALKTQQLHHAEADSVAKTTISDTAQKDPKNASFYPEMCPRSRPDLNV